MGSWAGAAGSLGGSLGGVNRGVAVFCSPPVVSEVVFTTGNVFAPMLVSAFSLGKDAFLFNSVVEFGSFSS